MICFYYTIERLGICSSDNNFFFFPFELMLCFYWLSCRSLKFSGWLYIQSELQWEISKTNKSVLIIYEESAAPRVTKEEDSFFV